MKLCVFGTLWLLLLGCSSEMHSTIEQLEFENGDTAFALKMPIPPHGEGYVVAPDATEASKALLLDIRESWSELWPEMISTIQATEQRNDSKVEFDSTFSATIHAVDDDEFMGDEADIMIGINPSADAVPVWHFFVREATIVHSQPVY